MQQNLRWQQASGVAGMTGRYSAPTRASKTSDIMHLGVYMFQTALHVHLQEIAFIPTCADILSTSFSDTSATKTPAQFRHIFAATPTAAYPMV